MVIAVEAEGTQVAMMDHSTRLSSLENRLLLHSLVLIGSGADTAMWCQHSLHICTHAASDALRLKSRCSHVPSVLLSMFFEFICIVDISFLYELMRLKFLVEADEIELLFQEWISECHFHYNSTNKWCENIQRNIQYSFKSFKIIP